MGRVRTMSKLGGWPRCSGSGPDILGVSDRATLHPAFDEKSHMASPEPARGFYDYSATTPDWTRERKAHFFAWDPPRSLIASLRSYQKWARYRNPLARCLKVVAVLRHRFWSVVTGAEIPICCEIGGGLLIPHPNGIVLHAHVRVGPNCMIFQQVTIGMLHDDGRAPVIGGHVDIGAGARILGSVTIGDHCQVGANAVLLVDMPSDSVAAGVPAVVRPRRRE